MKRIKKLALRYSGMFAAFTCGAALVGGFKAGRSFVRDIKNKFF